MKKLYDDMHNLFSLSKTLRFELKPIGKTKEYFMEYVLENDERKAQAYSEVKIYCDEVHKNFIEECLNNIPENKLTEFQENLKMYHHEISEKEPNNEKIDSIKKTMRGTISETFTKHNMYKEVLGEKILTEYAKDLYKDNEEAITKINEFNKFTTYFTGYHQTRENLYKNEDKHSAIAYRLIDENLQTFKNNLKLYEKFASNCPEKIEQISSELNLDPSSLFTDITQYTDCLTQKNIDRYNLIITGQTLENGKKIQGINEYINLYNQQNKDKTKLAKFKVLYKQLLSDRETTSFVLEMIENDNQVIEIIKNLYLQINSLIQSKEFIEPFKNLSNYDMERIYINNDTSMTDFSNCVFDDWSEISRIREEYYDKHYQGKLKTNSEKYAETRDKELKKEKLISLKFIEDNSLEKGKITEYFSKNIDVLITAVEKSYNDSLVVLEKEYNNSDKNLQNNLEAVEKIKVLLDSIKELQNFVKILIPKTDIERDLNFYNALNYELLSNVIPVYNKIRNYMTKKPYSEEKIKLNFDCPTLCGGWDLNKEESNLSVLFEKDGLYYLGIMNKKNNKLFREIPSDNFDNYRKIEYKLLPGPNKMLPKVFFSNSGIKEFSPSDELLRKYNQGLHKKEAQDIEFCHELIDFFKASINKHKDWKNFNFNFSDTNIYEDISQFYREVSEQGYKLTFKNVSSKYINELVQNGKLYLFQIYNKDFSQYSKGKPNLHTIYWKLLFDSENINNVVYKLNGEAEIFFRKKSIEYKVTHPKNVEFDNKNPENQDHKAKFEYDLIKDKRYALDKFMFHVPITLNFKAKGINKFNDYVNEQIKLADNVNIIGIDRGERHLLYVSVIDSTGKIIDKQQFSLNEIVNEYNGRTHKVNYHDLLAKKEEERDKARKSWSTIENIKELKEGYMSQVVHKIVELMFKYNAVVVLEDLNGGFKNSRKKVEKSVYDKFEKMLVNKLEYLVNKDVEGKFEQGGVLNAYQLAKSDIKGRQNGFIFFIPAWCTSKVDPITGFTNFFNVKYKNVSEAKKFIEKFDDIRYNSNENYYEFVVSDYHNFTDKNLGEKRKEWKICTFGQRIKTFRSKENKNQWVNEYVNLTEEFNKLFEEFSIDKNNIKSSISGLSDDEKRFFEPFINLFKLTVQLRNSITNSTDSKDDYILSPVKNAKGEFYDSRKYFENFEMPTNADANGAYNIARKGLMLINRIKNTQDRKKINFAISNAEYLDYIQSQDKA